MNQIVNKNILLLCIISLLSGCVAVEQKENDWERLEPIVVMPTFGSNYLLSCLKEKQVLEREEFNEQFTLAEAALKQGRKLDKLQFICLSLNEKADYKQFKHGTEVFDQFLVDFPESGDDMHGLRILVNQLEEEILNRWSAWKSLLNDKKELKAEVESLNVKIEEQQKQIEQLKNIENIIKSRENNK